MFAARHAGMTSPRHSRTCNAGANVKLAVDLDPDIAFSPTLVFSSAAAFEAVDFGSCSSPAARSMPTTFQFVEGEYVKAEEYDAFRTIPSALRCASMLRIYGTLAPLACRRPCLRS
jgi:hypothetical protein